MYIYIYIYILHIIYTKKRDTPGAPGRDVQDVVSYDRIGDNAT